VAADGNKEGKPFPPNFRHIAQTIMKRLFRVYSHVYHQHFNLIEQLAENREGKTINLMEV